MMTIAQSGDAVTLINGSRCGPQTQQPLMAARNGKVPGTGETSFAWQPVLVSRDSEVCRST